LTIAIIIIIITTILNHRYSVRMPPMWASIGLILLLQCLLALPFPLVNGLQSSLSLGGPSKDNAGRRSLALVSALSAASEPHGSASTAGSTSTAGSAGGTGAGGTGSAAQWQTTSSATRSIQDSQRVHDIMRKRQTRRGKPPALFVDEDDDNDDGDHNDDNDDDDEANKEQYSKPPPPQPLLSTTCPDKDSNTIHPTTKFTTTKTTNKVSSSKSKLSTTATATTTISNRTSNGIDFPFDVTLQALQAYHDEHSHLVLPRRYIVPPTDAYPDVCHGIDLAGTVYNMRWWQQHVKQRPDRVNELRRLGFVWERLQPEWNLILEGLIVYRAIYGHLHVPATFAVPFGTTRWPTPCWGIALGASVYRIRNRGDHLKGDHNAWSRRNQLDAIGFIWDTGEAKFAKFCSALQLFSAIEQGQQATTSSSSSALSSSRQQQQQRRLSLPPSIHSTSTSSSSSSPSITLKIPSQYVVPRSSRWPNEFWGYRLGERCAQVRQKGVYIKGHPNRVQALAELGFYVVVVVEDEDGSSSSGGGNGNDKLKWLEVVHAAALYSQMHSNSLAVPTTFVVPAPPRKVYNNNNNNYYYSKKVIVNGDGYSNSNNNNKRHDDDEEEDDHDESDNKKNGQVLRVVGSDEAWPWPGKNDDDPSSVRLLLKRYGMNLFRFAQSLLSGTHFCVLHCRCISSWWFFRPFNVRMIEYLWGFPLGQRLRDIRVKGYYLRGKNADARRRQLDALGFDWEPKRGRPTNKPKFIDSNSNNKNNARRVAK
jgi:hypothetical protein